MKPVPAPAMLPFRLSLVAAALLLSSVLFPGEAGAEWGLEITPYAGYTIGGSFTDNATGASLDVQEGELRARPRSAGHPGNPVRTLLRGPADEGHRRGDVRGGNPLRPGHPLPPPGGDLPVYRGEGPPLRFRGARRDALRAVRERDERENVLLPLAGRGSQGTDLRSRRPSLRGEGVHDDPAGLHGDLLRVVGRRCVQREGPGGRARSGPADGRDHLFIVRKGRVGTP